MPRHSRTIPTSTRADHVMHHPGMRSLIDHANAINGAYASAAWCTIDKKFGAARTYLAKAKTLKETGPKDCIVVGSLF